MVKVIKTEDDYRAALAEIDMLMELDPAPTTPEGEALIHLALLVSAYEEKHFPI